jgi:Ser/Thr protein kinase RdoA (MazF antagonist)
VGRRFDDCAHYWFAADMAFALRNLFHDRPSGVKFEGDRLRAFVSGYRDVRNLADKNLAAIPLSLSAPNC